jgi:ABC-2 type transport system ATP-binding protein
VTATPAVEVEDLTIRYGDLTAVDRLSFTAEGGEVVALLGPNGAGKTSTIETLEGFRRRWEGTARVLGLDPIRDHRALTRSVGVMLQLGGVPTGMRPAEAVHLYAAFYDQPRDPDGLLDVVGLTPRAKTPWRRLSGGEQQRLALALALIGRPKVAFLDEPTAGVDVSGRQLIRKLIRDLRDDGVCVLLATHELDEAEKVADRVVIIDHGRLVAAGTPTELTATSGDDELRFAAPSGIDTAALASHLHVTVDEVTPGEYRVATSGTPTVVAALTAWLAERDLPLGDLRANRKRLEDVFLRLTGDTAGDTDRTPGASA